MLGNYLGLTAGSRAMEHLGGIIQELVRERSLFKTDNEDDFEYEAAFPFYNLDMSYNIFKRLHEKYSGDVIEEEELVPGIVRFYEHIEELLEEEQEFYKDFIQPDYLKYFRSCPYIKALKKVEKEERGTKGVVKERIMDAFCNMAPTKPEKVTFELGG